MTEQRHPEKEKTTALRRQCNKPCRPATPMMALLARDPQASIILSAVGVKLRSVWFYVLISNVSLYLSISIFLTLVMCLNQFDACIGSAQSFRTFYLFDLLDVSPESRSPVKS